MANNTKLPWPLSIERQWDGPLEVDRLVNNLDELKALESKASNYCTMIVGCKSNGLLYKFNTTTNEFESLNIVPDAVNDNEATNLGQVKNLISNYIKEPVHFATTVDLGGTYSNNVLTLDDAISNIDGDVIQAGHSVLVKDQVNKQTNGIYVLNSDKKSLTRRGDFSSGDKIGNNVQVIVMRGKINADTIWMSTEEDVIIDSGSLIFKKSYVDINDYFWTGTTDEYRVAVANNVIKEGMVVNLTDDNHLFDSQDVYRTVITETNKSYLGKTVYRRMDNITSMSPSSKQSFVISNVESFFNISGVVTYGDYQYNIPHYDVNDPNKSISVDYRINQSGGYGVVYLYTGSSANITKGNIIIEYTESI